MSFFIDRKNSLWYFIIIEQKNGSQGRKWGDLWGNKNKLFIRN